MKTITIENKKIPVSIGEKIIENARNFEAKTDCNRNIDAAICKLAGMTKKQTIENAIKIAFLINYKREQRAEISKIEKIDTDRFKKQIRANWENKIENACKIRTNSGLRIEQSKDFSSRISESADWDYYAKSYNYPKVWKTTIFEMDFERFLKIPKNLRILDEIVNVKTGKTKRAGNNIIFIATWIKKTRGGYETKNGYIARNETLNINYHSDKSASHAIAGLERKIKAGIKTELKLNDITPDTVLTQSLFRKLTGACIPGIQEWKAQNNFENKKKAKLKEIYNLLPSYYKNMFKQAMSV
jgi:hypothetical protein